MIIKLDRVNSTNHFGLNKFAEFADNTLITADTQDSGRGRRGKSWYSPAGKNIYASYIIKRPLFPVYSSLWLCGLATLKTLRETAPKIELWLKWPNDVYCTPADSPEKKLKIAGLLAETFSPKGINKIEGVVAGIGINLNMTEDDIRKIDKPATSVLIETGRVTDIAEFAESLLKNLKYYREMSEKNNGQLYTEWKSENKLLGKKITVRKDDGTVFSGKVTGFSQQGELILCSDDGILHNIITGELTFNFR